MKNNIQYLLQRLLGFDEYLFLFARFKVATLRWDKNEKHIFHLNTFQLPDQSVILDVGANLGILTVHFARMFPTHQIMAFEPVPENYQVLCKMVTYYKLHNVSTFNIALSDGNGEVTMLMPVHGNTRKQGLSHVVNNSIPQIPKGKVYHIAARTLDDWWHANQPKKKIGLIKMDVENHESRVLRGGTACIREFRPYVLAELWDNENRVNAARFFEEIGGYSCKSVVHNRLVETDSKNPDCQNFFFIP